MIDIESDKNICDFRYLYETVGGNTKSVNEIMDIFLSQIPKDLSRIEDAVKTINYPIIKNIAHSMKSSVSIMGISILKPILIEMEDLASMKNNITRLRELNQELNRICDQAIKEIIEEKQNYSYKIK